MDINGLTTTNRQAVEEVPYGMYVWKTPDGEILGDDDGNIMNVFVWKVEHRPAARKALADAARHYGFPEGEAVWWSGKRQVTDEELAEQEARERLGLIPDPMDYGALKEQLRANNE